MTKWLSKFGTHVTYLIMLSSVYRSSKESKVFLTGFRMLSPKKSLAIGDDGRSSFGLSNGIEICFNGLRKLKTPKKSLAMADGLVGGGEVGGAANATAKIAAAKIICKEIMSINF